jgi:hypothetical protein
MNVLRRENQAVFRIEECLDNPAINEFRQAIITFLLGGFIRRWHVGQTNVATRNPVDEALPKYAFIVHSETAKASHLWQVRLVERIRDDLRQAGATGQRLRELVRAALDDLRRSLKLANLPVPQVKVAVAGVFTALDAVMVHKVNSETQLAALLTPQGELNLVAHYNVFVGGNILDRGVTVPNVIGFFYGRRPNTSQQDTVLQHCRMYGYRPSEDLAVTRFYTTAGIYASMLTIHQFDTALRTDIEAGRQPPGVYFLQRDAQGRVRACGPQKVLASRVDTVTPNTQKLLLPLGFDVRDDASGNAATTWIDNRLSQGFGAVNDAGPRYGNIDADFAAEILEHIKRSLDFSATDGWDAKGHGVLLKYLAKALAQATQPHQLGQVMLAVSRGANQARIRPDGRLQNYFVFPREVDAARAQLVRGPGLLIVRQRPGAGFRSQPFWWPMILIPAGIEPLVFALD